MINKVYFKNFINSTIISLFGIGTIVVCFYIFFGTVLSVYFALIAYALGFSVLAIACIRNAVVLSSQFDRAKTINTTASEANASPASDSEIQQTEEQQDLKEKTDSLYKQIKTRRNIEIFKSVMSTLFAMFTILVLLLY